MLHTLAIASASSEIEGKTLPFKAGAILHGPLRPDLIRDELLCEIFAATVARDPSATAMITQEGKLSYAEVDASAEALAKGLLRKGIRPGRIVGLWMPRGHELLIAQIAIAKTGAAWLPFDADAPVERIAVCLSDAEAWGVLTSADLVAEIAALAACPAWTYAEVLTNSLDVADTEFDARALGARPDDPAYLIYTSGSTGTPKGIVISGRNICHYLRAANEIYGVRETDVVFQGASVAFDLSMEEIWLPYLVGATLFVASAEMMGEADKLPSLMEEHHVTVLDTVPTLLASPAPRRRDLAFDHPRRRSLPAGDRQHAGAGRGARSSIPMGRRRRRSSQPSLKCGPAGRSRSAGPSRTTPAMWRMIASIFSRPESKASSSSAAPEWRRAICAATA